MINKTEILLPESNYHVYNRANGSEKLFRSAENYRYFLQKYQEYISPVANTFCYCLMPNHFHFLIRVKPERELVEFFAKKSAQGGKSLTGFETLSGIKKEKALSGFLSLQFSHLFNSYTQALNKQLNRRGGLFMRPFKRKQVSNQEYLYKLVHYIHYNPVEAGFSASPAAWPYSSYPSFLNDELNSPEKTEVIRWFEGKHNFIHAHSELPEVTNI